MADIEIHIESNIADVERATKAAIERALEACGLQAEGYAKLRCAVDTGLLRNSITHVVSGHSFTRNYSADRPDKSGNVKSGSVGGSVGSDDEQSVYIGTNVEYAPYVEYGTSRSEAQPFLKPALENNIEEYKRIFENYLKSLN